MIYEIEELKRIFPLLNFNWISEVKEVINFIPGEWRFVGGCVRDSLLGIKTYDIDIATLCKPDVIETALIDKFTLNVIGKKFGTIGVYYKGWSIEITTARKDVENFGRHAEVDFDNVGFYEDSSRRDFTINSLMLTNDLKLYDYHNGIEDLQNKTIRFVGDSDERIREDYLRIMRYIRFFIRFSDGDYGKDMLIHHVKDMINLSKERIVKEMESMCKNHNVSKGFLIMNEIGISNLFFNGSLNVNIDDDLPINRKMAYALYNVDISKWPVNKHVKRIHGLKVPDTLTIEEYVAYIWNKHKDVEVIDEFNELLKYLNKPPVVFDFNIDMSLSARFEGKNRGMAELFMRYYHIMGLKFDYDTINSKKDLFYYRVIKSIK